MLVGSDPIFVVHREKLVALVAAAAIPAIYQYRDFTTAGGLISYDPDIADAYRQSGVYAGKILRGALPADLPIQQPRKSNSSSTSGPRSHRALKSRRRCSPAPTT